MVGSWDDNVVVVVTARFLFLGESFGMVMVSTKTWVTVVVMTRGGERVGVDPGFPGV